MQSTALPDVTITNTTFLADRAIIKTIDNPFIVQKASDFKRVSFITETGDWRRRSAPMQECQCLFSKSPHWPLPWMQLAIRKRCTRIIQTKCMTQPLHWPKPSQGSEKLYSPNILESIDLLNICQWLSKCTVNHLQQTRWDTRRSCKHPKVQPRTQNLVRILFAKKGSCESLFWQKIRNNT